MSVSQGTDEVLFTGLVEMQELPENEDSLLIAVHIEQSGEAKLHRN